jgi:hypothetical protein
MPGGADYTHYTGDIKILETSKQVAIADLYILIDVLGLACADLSSR